MSAALDALRNLSRRPFNKADFLWMVEVLHTNQNDSLVAIVGGVFVEGALRDVILSKLRASKTENRELFRANAPLSSFDSLISMGFALSIYGPDFRHDIDTIRQIRNAFAHSPRQLTFATPEVVGVCNTFRSLNMAAKFNETPETAREKFSFVVRNLATAFLLLTDIPDRPEPPRLP